ncbi:MAG: sigma-70 family RNA polymerase sigma factor [Acidimicrobiales bacterium]
MGIDVVMGGTSPSTGSGRRTTAEPARESGPAPTDPTSPTADDAGFDALYRTERLPMVRLAHLITGSNAAAEDLVHEAFLKVRPRFADLRDPGAYLRTTVVNECRMWFRRRDVEARHAPTPSDQLQLPPELDETWAALQQLSPKRRIVVFLRFYEDRSIDDIAEILRSRPGTVRSLLRRGLASLREVLTDGS